MFLLVDFDKRNYENIVNWRKFSGWLYLNVSWWTQILSPTKRFPVSETHWAVRVLIAFEENLLVLPAAENFSDKLEERHKILLSKNNISSDPVECNSDFTDGRKMWTKRNIWDVFSYFVSSKAFATEYIDQYKAKKLVIILKAVLWIKLINNRAKNNTGEVLVKTSVVPSQKINEKNPINYGFFSAVKWLTVTTQQAFVTVPTMLLQH